MGVDLGVCACFDYDDYSTGHFNAVLSSLPVFSVFVLHWESRVFGTKTEQECFI